MMVVGTPSACFMPAAKYKFRYVSELMSLTVPIRGTRQDESPHGGTFDICPKPGVFLFGTLLEVLFTQRVYPALTENQRFVLSGLEVDGEELHVVGRIIEFLED